ncbi:MAG: hypothetical protein LBC62_07050 [Treponema sp.]|jgi:hypothetical protein|nr:hypothetical protein [Treponema sp.]
MSDWYPGSRDAQIHLIETWLRVFLTRATEWGIPEAVVTELAAIFGAAKDILAFVKSGERTPASVVHCNEIFKDLETQARYIKKHYLLVPPLTLADLALLLLPQPDSTYTPVGKPTGQPSVTVTYPGGPHLLQVHLTFLAGTQPLDSRSDYGYALYRGVMPQGGATLEQAASAKHYLMKPPLDGDDGLLHYRFTHRRTETVSFAAEEAGMTAYFCSRYENGKGEPGDWGPVVSAIIP